jgi:hypothetical protein
MKVNKKTSIGGAFARKVAYEYEGKKYEADLKDGDSVEILNAGTEVEGQFGTQLVFSIRTRNGEKNIAFNQKSINTLIDAYGDETSAWVGKMVNVFIIKAMVSGKLQNVAYFAPEGYEMDDEGNFRKSGAESGLEETDVPF